MVINATLSNSNSSWSVVQVDFTDRQVFELKLFLLLMLMLSHHPSEIIWDYFPWEWIWLIPKIIFVLPFFALLWNELSKICSVIVFFFVLLFSYIFYSFWITLSLWSSKLWMISGILFKWFIFESEVYILIISTQLLGLLGALK